MSPLYIRLYFPLYLSKIAVYTYNDLDGPLANAVISGRKLFFFTLQSKDLISTHKEKEGQIRRNLSIKRYRFDRKYCRFSNFTKRYTHKMYAHETYTHKAYTHKTYTHAVYNQHTYSKKCILTQVYCI
jgi:hypothetical protein